MSQFQLFSVPSPLTGSEGTLLVSFCIPNTPDWWRTVRAMVGLLTRGRRYDGTTGNVKQAATIGEEILGSMSTCDLETLIVEIRRLTDALTGGSLDPTQPGALDPAPWDYSTDGVVPNLNKMFMVDNLLFPDEGLANVLLDAFRVDNLDFPLPFEGKGMAEVTRDEMKILQDRFIMTDSSIFNPLTGTKNMVEVLETTLRTDRLSDLEFLTPNITTILDQVTKLDPTSPLGLAVWNILASLFGLDPQTLPEYNTFAEMLAGIMGQIKATSENPQPINLSVSLSGACKCSGASCGCGGGSAPSDEGTEGQPAPDGWVDPVDDTGAAIVPGEPAYQDRKCQISNAIHQQIEELVTKLNSSSIVTVLAELLDETSTEATSAIVGAILGELATPIPILDALGGAVIGWFAGLLIELTQGDLDLAQLSLDLSANEQQLVCALYDSKSGSEAISAYTQVLSDAGTSTPNLALISSILVYDIVNLIFFQSSRLSAAFEALSLSGYTGPVDCASCVCGSATDLQFGPNDARNGQAITFGRQVFTSQPGFDGKERIHVLVNPDGASCEVIIHSVTEPGNLPLFRRFHTCDGQDLGYEDHNLQGLTVCVVEINMYSDDPAIGQYQADLEIVQIDCTGGIQQ